MLTQIILQTILKLLSMNKRYIIYIIILCLYAVELNAQGIATKSYYSFKRIEDKTPWLTSLNGTGLIYNTIENSFSTVGAYFKNINGDYRNYNEAKEINNFGLATKSYTRINNFYFYGSFNYDYTINNNIAWAGTAYTNTNINPILDSIPGKSTREAYIINAKAAYKFSQLFSAGATFNYKTATLAKKNDGRNKNDFSNLYISPGINFTTKYINIGANLSYEHNAEQVKYDYFGDITGKYLCYMEGLFMYSISPITLATITERRYEKDIMGGSLQFQLKLGNFSFYNNFIVERGKEDDFEDNMLKKRYAKVETLNYNYSGEFKYSFNCMENLLKIKYLSYEELSYGIVNNYEQIPNENNMWEYYEYGSVLRYMSQIQKFGIEYNGFIKENDYLSKVDFTVGYNYTKSNKKEKIFPAEYSQNYKVSNYYASVNKNFLFGLNIVKLNVCGGFSMGSGVPLVESNPITTGAIKLNKELLYHDYAYKVSNSYRIGCGVNYSHIINKQKGQVISLEFSYLYSKLNKFIELAKSNRNLLNVSMEFNF